MRQCFRGQNIFLEEQKTRNGVLLKEIWFAFSFLISSQASVAFQSRFLCSDVLWMVKNDRIGGWMD
jgi:hypothetical protein